MTTERDDGGSAFPCIPPVSEGGGSAAGYPYPDAGMTLRDYFAGRAMQGLVAVPVEQWAELKWTLGLTVGEAMAIQAYKIADAMLKARQS